MKMIISKIVVLAARLERAQYFLLWFRLRLIHFWQKGYKYSSGDRPDKHFNSPLIYIQFNTFSQGRWRLWVSINEGNFPTVAIKTAYLVVPVFFYLAFQFRERARRIQFGGSRLPRY